MANCVPAGVPTGKVHVEYDTVLAARKALHLSTSLLLDRPVFVSAYHRRLDAASRS